ncbi:LysR family transcriptional regulator substrate-binding protein [Streptomyces sp. NPDC002851]
MTPAKWVRIWEQRLPGTPLILDQVPAAAAFGVLRDEGADAGLVRLPAEGRVGDDLCAIPLYTETTVVVVPKDHLVTAADEVSLDDLADDIVLHPLDDTLDWGERERPPGQPAFERPATTADAIELVAAGVGILVVPQSLARLYHRRDLTYRPVVDAPTSRVALSWVEERTTDQVEDFIGIVRGRTVNSTRGRRTEPAAEPSAKGAPRRKATGSGKAGGAGKAAGSGRPGAGGKSGTGTSQRRGTGSGGGAGVAGRAKGAKRGRPRRRS